jgi:SAM-dependent methyltransferase
MTTHRADADQLGRIRDLFDEWARHGRGDRMAESHWPFARQALERLPLTPSSWFLDIGCGTGYAVCWAARIVHDGRAVGIDLSDAMVARARECSVGLPNADFHVGRFPTHHTLPAARFDVAFSMETFYYFADLDAALREAHRLLAPGGRFACVVDYYGENAASHGWPQDVGVPMHLLDAAGWHAAFRRAGFGDVRQDRLRIPAAETSEPWKTTEGSLLTLGRHA